MVLKHKLLLLASLFWIAPVSAQSIDISMKHNSVSENAIRQKLLSAFEKYQLQKWTVTNKVMIDDETRIPFSHPVLTLNGIPSKNSPIDQDEELVAIYVHEQGHWNSVKHGKLSMDEAAAAIKKFAKNLRSDFPYGSGDLVGTLNHVPVCYSEYRVLSQLFGEEAARKKLESKHYYKDIYAFVLDPANHPAIEQYLKEEGLTWQQFGASKK